jgi:hypothetical protein
MCLEKRTSSCSKTKLHICKLNLHLASPLFKPSKSKWNQQVQAKIRPPTPVIATPACCHLRAARSKEYHTAADLKGKNSIKPGLWACFQALGTVYRYAVPRYGWQKGLVANTVAQADIMQATSRRPTRRWNKTIQRRCFLVDLCAASTLIPGNQASHGKKWLRPPLEVKIVSEILISPHSNRFTRR